MNETDPYAGKDLNRTEGNVGGSAACQRTGTIGEAWKSFWTHWTFEGRASRADYWWMQLCLMIIAFATGFFIHLVGDSSFATIIGIIYGIFNLASAWPGLCIVIRRLHDTGRSGGWYWILLIPIVGAFMMLYWMLKSSEPSSNRYGPVPYTDS